MEIKTEYKSVLNMLDLKIIDASFHMSEDGVQEAELGVSVDRKLEKDETDNYRILLGITVCNESKTLVAEAKCLGVFKTSNDNYPLIERLIYIAVLMWNFTTRQRIGRLVSPVFLFIGTPVVPMLRSPSMTYGKRCETNFHSLAL